MSDYAGKQLGDFRLIEQIGAGGMGEVFLAKNIHHRKQYALKVLPEELSRDADFRRRFFDEARVMSDLDHANIVRVHHTGEHAGTYYLVMDYITGPGGQSWSLHNELKESPGGRVEPGKALRWIIQIAEALAYAHGRGVIHRDIKPANTLITADGNVKITDFGLAKAIGSEFILSQIHESLSLGQRPSIVHGERRNDEIKDTLDIAQTNRPAHTPISPTDSTGILGTYDYMSPEQREGATVDERSDVYSLGVLIYRMLTGRRVVGMAKPPSRMVKGLPAHWDAIVERCLEYDPAARYAGLSDLLPELRRIGDKPKTKAQAAATLVEAHEVLEKAEPKVEPPLAVAPFDAKQAREYQHRTAKAIGAPLEKSIELAAGVTMDFILIPAGRFMMGSENGGSDEKPVHPATITRPFYMGATPVTQEQYRAITNANPSEFSGPNLPVECVTWEKAAEFCARLGKDYHLPTEAQWEYACRAGSDGDYWFGDDESELSDYAWHQDNSRGKTHPVAQKRPNPLGLHDMHGNVWEWCADWFHEKYYSMNPTADPQGPSKGTSRVLRGGSWRRNPRYCRSASRYRIAPDLWGVIFGFRVVVLDF